MGRLASAALVALVVASAAIVAATSAALPDRVATHFAIDGRANGWMTRDAYGVTMGTLALVLPLASWSALAFVPRRWPRLVSVPFRDYWLAPGRREATCVRLARLGATVALLAAALIGVLHVEIVEANHRVPPSASAGMAWVTVAFALAIAATVIATAVRFRVPKAPRR
ncbi:MAG TPA: DUF1648 domain-containing protein [Casimicrobiaceae bacterium]|nr:DUF1648 domain-containing protein [Casimicrobiaceae bacterium]